MSAENAARGTSRHDTPLPAAPGRPGAAPGPGAAPPRAGPGVPLSVWPGLPAAGGAPPGLPCGGPVTTAAAARVIESFSRPGDLVVAVDGSPAAASAAAAAGRVVLGLAPGGPARLLAAGGPGCRDRRPGHHRLPGPEPDGGGLLYAACERVLRPGGVLAVITPGPGGDGPPGDLPATWSPPPAPPASPTPSTSSWSTPPSTATASTPPAPRPAPPARPAAPASTPTC